MPSVAAVATRRQRTPQRLLQASLHQTPRGLYGASVGSRSGGAESDGLSGRLGRPPRPEFSAEDDRRLLQRHVAGEPDAFGELVRRHGDRLWAVALRTLGNPEDAADAVQDAVLAAYRRAETFRGDAAVSTWLHRIVINACLDLIRRRSVRPVEQLRPGSADPALPRDPIEDQQRRLDIVAALAALPVEQRVALVLVDIEGYPVDEVAKMLEVPSGTVKSRCARGRARLAGLLAPYRNQTPPGSVPSGSSTDIGHNPEQEPGRFPAADRKPGTEAPR